MGSQADEAARLRQMFLDVLDGMEVNQSTVDSQQSTEGENKFSLNDLTTENRTGYNKNTSTDEFTSIGMRWANHPDTNVGDKKRVYNGKKVHFRL